MKSLPDYLAFGYPVPQESISVWTSDSQGSLSRSSCLFSDATDPDTDHDTDSQDSLVSTWTLNRMCGHDYNGLTNIVEPNPEHIEESDFELESMIALAETVATPNNQSEAIAFLSLDEIQDTTPGLINDAELCKYDDIALGANTRSCAETLPSPNKDKKDLLASTPNAMIKGSTAALGSPLVHCHSSSSSSSKPSVRSRKQKRSKSKKLKPPPLVKKSRKMPTTGEKLRGVSLHKRSGKFDACAWNSDRNKQEFLGSFDVAEKAAVARDIFIYHLYLENQANHTRLSSSPSSSKSTKRRKSIRKSMNRTPETYPQEILYKIARLDTDALLRVLRDKDPSWSPLVDSF